MSNEFWFAVMVLLAMCGYRLDVHVQPRARERKPRRQRRD